MDFKYWGIFRNEVMDKVYALLRGWVRLIKVTIKDEDFQFRLRTGGEIILIPCMTFLSLLIFIWFTLKINLIYLRSNGYSKIEILETAYYEYFLNTGLQIIPYIFLFLIINFFIGNYIGALLLRPFRIIANYCQNKLDGREGTYDPDFFTDLKRLTSFSEFFFNTLNTAKLNKSLDKVSIPSKFTKIHGPKFESSFFIQYFLILLLNSGVIAGLIYLIITNLYSDLVRLSIETIPLKEGSQYFLNQQESVFSAILWGVMGFHFILTILLALFFYSKVSGPAFGIFATMKSFLKGNHSARVHLIGYYYIRPYCRVFNKYLDDMQRKLTNNAE